MNGVSKEMELIAPATEAPQRRSVAVGKQVRVTSSKGAIKSRPQTLLAVPVAAGIALAIHYFVPKSEPLLGTNYFPTFLQVVLALGVIGVVAQNFSEALRRWMRQMCPILGIAVIGTAVWELITACLGLLPLPYFPGPEGVMAALASDRGLLFDSTWHSLTLLLSGYAI